MKIALVIGHRKGSQGAYGNSGVSEWEFYKELMFDVLAREEMKQSDNKFKIFFRKEEGSGYTERMKELHKRIDKWGAEVSVSFHFNASSNADANGHEVLYNSNGGRRNAREMNDLFDIYLSNRNRGIKHRSKRQRGGGFLARGKSKCILVEPFFASHQNMYLDGGEERENLINAFVDFLQ